MKTREQIIEKRKSLYEQAKEFRRLKAQSASEAERNLNDLTAHALANQVNILTWVLEETNEH